MGKMKLRKQRNSIAFSFRQKKKPVSTKRSTKEVYIIYDEASQGYGWIFIKNITDNNLYQLTQNR